MDPGRDSAYQDLKTASVASFVRPIRREGEKMPRGRPPKLRHLEEVERQEALKNRIVGLSEELAANGFNDLLIPLVPIKPVRRKSWTKKRQPESPRGRKLLAVYLQRLPSRPNLSQRPPFDHIADPIYRRLMRDSSRAPNAEVKIAALRDLSGRIKSLDEKRHQLQHQSTACSVPGAIPPPCFCTASGKAGLPTGCITVEAWDYFGRLSRSWRPSNRRPDPACQNDPLRDFITIDLEGLLHYMVTFNTAQRPDEPPGAPKSCATADRRN